ncbi:unnamed protein product [Peronospora belbahrii]|uniref:Sister chromatid cohesion protein n=1 Tax=Peronospora belbahrii TaxID=622444 RepID=A0AAU9KX53_9STRA|nr:unnamed protein product [Peronospora belbahrii]CAH0517844.1 unnamed protein product [Peronospora belbahrii]
MRGGLFLFPLYMDPQDAADADARETIHPVVAETIGAESFNPQRLATIIRSATTSRLGSANETTEINADVFNSLPKWAQAVVQTGCFNAGAANGMKRNLELQQEIESKQPRKRRSIVNVNDGQMVTSEGCQLQTCSDELNAELEADAETEAEEKFAALLTQAKITADSIEKYAELLERFRDMATYRQQQKNFVQDNMDVLEPEAVKILLQSLKAMEKNEWINKLEPELLISLMSAFDIQVKMGLATNVLEAILLDRECDKSQPKTIDDQLVARLLASLDVAICELIVITTPQIDRRVLSEDIIDNCFQLLHHIIRRLLLPCIDSTYVTTASAPISKESNRRHLCGRKTSSSSRINIRSQKDTRKAIDRVSHVVCEYMDRLATLVLDVTLSDRWILPLSSSMVELFALEHSLYATSLQQSALAILRSIFLRYKNHRESLLEDIVEVMFKLPTAKRTLRTVKLLNSTHLVQQISTVVVSLIQACASAFKPKTEDSGAGSLSDSVELLSTPDTATEEKDLQKIDAVESILEEAQNYARSFVQKLLKACWKKTEERDNRVVLDNFTEDLLVMLVRPEWAGAEDLLEALSSSLASILHANILKNAKNRDSHQSIVALNVIGKICASIRQYHNEVSQSTMEEDSDSIAIVEEHLNSLYVVVAGAKTKSNGALPSAACGEFHQMALKHITVMHLQRNSFRQDDSKKLLILKYLSESGEHWSETESACEEGERNLWGSLWEVPKGGINPTFKVAVPTSELALKASLNLAVKRGFCGLFDNLLAHIMALLSKGMPSLRARVMRCLRVIVDVDPMLMAESGVQLAVQRCCSDEKPSVREAAVELVGTYALLQPVLFDKYFDVLAARVRDKGIKVRKSVCKIFKIVLARDVTTEQELRRKSACMRCLVERIRDAGEDQSVKNFIIDAFQEVWFGAELSSARLSTSSSEFCSETTLPPGWTSVATNVGETSEADLLLHGNSKFVSEDGIVANSVGEAWSSYRTPTVTPACVVKSNASKLDNTFDVVTTIVEVIHGMSDVTWFTELLKRLLGMHNNSAAPRCSKNRSAEIAIAEERSEKIIAHLVGCLIDIQEGKLLNAVSIKDGHQQFVSCMTALSAFCEAKPKLLVRHLETIRVYLKENDAKIQRLSVSMINNILSVKRVPQTIAERLECDLKNLVLRSPPSVVGPSVKCLATLSTTRYKAQVLLLRLLERFYLSMRDNGHKASFCDSPEQDYMLQRALYAAGKIVGATDIDKCQELAKETKVLSVGTITESLYELYSQFVCMPGKDSCTAKAVQGMGFLFPIRPRLFLRAQQDGLLHFLLKSDSLKAKLQCLVSMKELLLFEEQRLENGQASRTMNQLKSKEQQVQGDQEADASLIGNVMQAELGNILRLSLYKVPQIRKQAIICIGALLTQGLVNPLQCIPNLVALETDRIPDVRDTAFLQLMTLYERFWSQFHTPLIKGIQASYLFQLSVYGNCTALGIVNNEKEFCLFGRLYTNCLKPIKSHESLLLKALVNQFTDQGSVLKPLKNHSVTVNNSKTFASDLNYLCYLAQIISTLPYDVEDEPLYIIYLVNRYVSLRLGHVLEDLKQAFIMAGVAPKQLEDEDSDLSMVRIDESRPFRPQGESTLSTLQSNGRIAFAIALLLRLKFALKRNYHLDNEKCATYKPSATEIPVEAKERSSKKLLLPCVDDLCRTGDPIELSWNLFMVAWHAARKDQKQSDINLEEELKPKIATIRRRRSRKSVTSKSQKIPENDNDNED